MNEIWFEVRVDSDLAGTLQKVINAYKHKGVASRARLLQRVEDAIPEGLADRVQTEET